jgi:hypothetical protein
MTILDKKFVIPVGVFFALTGFYLLANKNDSVYYAILSFSLKDGLLIALSSAFLGQSKLSDYFAISLMCYLLVPTIIRVNCAIKSNFNYLEYRELLSNSDYSYFLLLVLLFI